MASYRTDWIRLIRTLAQKYRVDPRAALAVASAEGLGGGVGDAGTSFGPFQLHVGGALPQGRGRAWAESPAGIEYALRQIGQVAGGLQGPQAIASIVRRFERPADPSGEITRAQQAYGQFGGGGPVQAGAAPPAAAPGPTRPPAQNNALRQSVLSSLAAGKPIDFLALARNMPRQAPTPPTSPTGTTPQQTTTPARTGRFQTADRGKIIGTPYSGTHTLYGNWESDKAVDIALPVGTPIYAPFSGTIGSQIGSLNSGDPRLLGLRVHLDGSAENAYFAHLSRLAVRAGQQVKQGQLLGYSGSANGVAHLHFATRRKDPRTYVG